MLINIIEFISFVALIFYIIFGGADYGAGILEFFKPHKIRKIDSEIEHIITKAIGPVWEANHIWLILIIVILFNGFPELFLTLTTYLHLPLVAVLLGIVLRGVAFTFRHYDIFEGNPKTLYTRIFSISSLWTSLWLGIIAGSIILGRIDPTAKNVYALYIHPWFNYFCLSLGVFVASLFTYLASSFLIGETDNVLIKKYFRQRSLIANIAVIVSGGVVFFTAQYEGFFLMNKFFYNSFSITMMILATIFWLCQEIYRKRLTFLLRRILVVGQVTFILLGFFFVQAPTVISTATGPLTMANTAAPEATLFQLVVALIVGLFLIIPSLLYLFWIFKFKQEDLKL